MKKSAIASWRGLVVTAVFGLFISGIPTANAAPARIVGSPFLYNFNVDGVLEEAGTMDESSSPYWWLNSGGVMPINAGVGQTNQGELPATNKWRVLYSKTNPYDTDNGYHPQNIFRLVTRSKWQNFQQQAYFKIVKDNLSQSSNRNASNGLLLMSNYLSGNTLYYAGIRTDGAAVIKKKINGKYFTLGYKKIYDGTYNVTSNPNLLPKDIWIGLRTEARNLSGGKVNIKLFADQGRTGNWKLILESTDDAKSYGGAAITSEGYAGVRTDFMDVQFEDYKNTKF